MTGSTRRTQEEIGSGGAPAAVGDGAWPGPVFIIGCPRSGTTLALDLLASHGAFAWVSNRVNRSPQRLELTRLNRVYDLPLVGKHLYAHRGRRPFRRLPAPAEPWRFWEAYLSRFRWARGGPVPPRRRTAVDITPEEVQRIRSVVQQICSYEKKGRFLSKYTGLPRIRYLCRAFPEAKFIHVLRDGRAVAFSLYERLMDQWSSYWEERAWWVRGWPAAWREEFTQTYGCPLAFGAYQWKFFVSEIWKDAESLPSNQYLEVRYRDLISSPDSVLEAVFRFCGLEMSSRAAWHHSRTSLVDMNYKWREELYSEQKAMLRDIICEEEFIKVLDDSTR